MKIEIEEVNPDNKNRAYCCELENKTKNGNIIQRSKDKKKYITVVRMLGT